MNAAEVINRLKPRGVTFEADGPGGLRVVGVDKLTAGEKAAVYGKSLPAKGGTSMIRVTRLVRCIDHGSDGITVTDDSDCPLFREDSNRFCCINFWV